MSDDKECYELTEEGRKYAQKLIREKPAARDMICAVTTNELARWLTEEPPKHPIEVIRKILEADVQLGSDGIDWLAFIQRLERQENGKYAVKDEVPADGA
ncbi:hypothetical protein DSECCO2_213140 [anaerobic digester metagenome]